MAVRLQRRATEDARWFCRFRGHFCRAYENSVRSPRPTLFLSTWIPVVQACESVLWHHSEDQCSCAEEEMRRLNRCPGWRLLSLLVGLLLFLWVMQRSGFNSTYKALIRIDGFYFLLACSMFAGASLIRLWKWYIMQACLNLSLGLAEVCRLYFITRVGGLVTPLRGGEIVPSLFSKHKSKLLSVTLFDRAIEGFRTLVVVLVALIGLSQRGILLPLRSTLFVTAVFFALFVGVLIDRRILLWFFVRTRPYLERVEHSKLGRKIGLWETNLLGGVNRFYDSVEVLWTPGRSLFLLCLTFVAWFFDILVGFFTFYAVRFPLPLGAVITSIVLFSASNFIAPTPSGLGVGDFVLMTTIQSLGYEGTAGPFLIVSRGLVVILTFVGYFLFHGVKVLPKWRSKCETTTPSRN